MIVARVVAGVPAEGKVTDAPVAWWSFGKTVLAAAVLALVRDGKADLEAPLAGESYSLRTLLQHTAGLPDYCSLRVYREAIAKAEPPWTDEEFMAHTLAPHVRRPSPGEFSYSNLGYLLVRRWIEATTGEDIETAVNQLLLRPMQIEGVRFARTPQDLAATAWGNEDRYHPGWVGHGLLIGPPVSAALFLDRLIMGPTIPAPLLKEMRGSIVVGGPIEGRPFAQPSYGLGVMMDPKAPAGRMVGHTGQGPTTTAAIYRFPDARPDCTIAVFANSPHQGPTEWACVRAAMAKN